MGNNARKLCSCVVKGPTKHREVGKGRACMKPRARLVRNAQIETPPSAEKGVDRLMTQCEFSLVKKYLLPEIRSKGDPPPRIVRPGDGDRKNLFANVRALLEKTPGGRIVRGYKMFVVPLDLSVWKCPAWKAQFHIVVRRPSPSGQGVYECANIGHSDADWNAPFIFVPSSRAHRELSDADLLADKYVPGYVVGGNTVFADAICIDQSVRGRRYSVVATCPEMCVAQRNVVVRLLPRYSEWFRLRDVKGDLQNLAEQMGMPAFNVGEPVDIDDMELLYNQVTLNTGSLISGIEGIKMEMEARRKLMCGETTFAQVRLDFFDYYDRSHKQVCDLMDQQLAERHNALRLST